MKLAIVTGASRGLGQAIAAALLAAGWRVTGIARGEMSGLTGDANFRAIQADLADPLAAVAALEEALAGSGTAEELCLINNAGTVAPVGPAGRLATGDIAAAVSLNLTSIIALTDTFLRLTKSAPARRRIAGISSGAAHTAYAGWGVYCATKAGLDHFTRCVALEQAHQSNPARIAAIAPGVVDTAMQGELRETSAEDFPLRQRFVDLQAGGNLQAPATVAAKLLACLDSPAFGDPPVVDLRTL